MGQSVRPLSCTETMYAFQERPENFSDWLAPRSGSAAAQRNAAGRVLKAHASEKRCRRNSQRVGAWARNETNKVSGAKPSPFVALLHGRGVQRETLSKSARIPDQTGSALSGVRVGAARFPGYRSLRVKIYRPQNYFAIPSVASGDGKSI